GFAATRGFPVEFVVQGPDWDKLTELTRGMMAKMKDSGFVTDVNTDVQPGMPEAQIIPNREKCAARGVSLSSVTTIINGLVGGAILTGMNEYQKGRHRYQIELRLVGSERAALDDLDRIRLRNNRGETVRLSEVAEKRVRPGLMLISRRDRAR